MSYRVTPTCECHGWTFGGRTYRTRFFARAWARTMIKAGRRRGGTVFRYEVTRVQ